MFSLEMTQSLTSPYTCYGLRALCYGWSAVVLWSHLFFLHVYGLRARRYGLWVSQGREFNIEYIARAPLVLPLSPSLFNNYRPEHVQRCFLWKRLSHQFFPKRATGSALYVMGGRLQFLGHVCYPCTCMGSALDVMDYGLAKAIGTSSRPTGRTLVELRITASGLKLQRLFRRTIIKLHILHIQAPNDKYFKNICFLCFRAF